MDDKESRDEWDEEEQLFVPAGALRVATGLIVMASSVVAAGVSHDLRVKSVAALLFFLSIFIMLKRPDKDTGK